MRRLLTASLLVLSIMVSSVFARPVPILSHAELLKRADLVLVVQPTKSADQEPGEPRVSIRDDYLRYLTPVVTDCNVLSVLKGTHAKKTIALPHYRLDWVKAKQNGSYGLGNGPCLVTFMIDRKPDDPFDDALVGGTFLVYLVTLDDGTHSFVTGQHDPRFSVFSLSPMPANGG